MCRVSFFILFLFCDIGTQSVGGLQGRSGATPHLAAVAAEITLDEGLLGLLRGAFDSEGELSAT